MSHTEIEYQAILEAYERAQECCDEQFLNEAALERDITNLMRELEIAWGIIANAGGGNWSTQEPKWVQAASHFADRFHALKFRYAREL